MRMGERHSWKTARDPLTSIGSGGVADRVRDAPGLLFRPVSGWTSGLKQFMPSRLFGSISGLPADRETPPTHQSRASV